MEWLSVCLALLSTLFIYKVLRDESALICLGIGVLGSSFLVLLVSQIYQSNMMEDEEFRSSIVIEARFYEEWETWVEKTCSRQVVCGEDCSTDSQGKRSCSTRYCTEYYDCSYCDNNPEYWEAYDNRGHSWNISQSEYNFLVQKWSSPKQFVDLNRSILKHYSCGKDGDMYSARWDGNVFKTESYNWKTSFVNRTKLSKSAFNFKQIEKPEADSLKLYHYPDINGYKQPYILGADKLKLSPSQLDSVVTLSKHFNGYHGPTNKLHLFILIFDNKSQSIALKQEEYWEGGNQNELVVCIGQDKGKILWVKAFSWTDNKKVLVDIREDISELDTLNLFKVFDILHSDVNQHFKYKNLNKDFEYLDVDLSVSIIIWIWVIVLIFNVLLVVFIINRQSSV